MNFARKILYKIKILIAYLKPSKYEIKRGYLHRNRILLFDDSNLTDEYQNEVYQRAKDIYQEKNLSGVIDFGCGSAYKLLKSFQNEPIIGVELDSTQLKEKYPNMTWYDFKDKHWISFNAEMLICADVIEHVANPDKLLNDLSKLTQIKYWIFSTPDRNLDSTPWNFGPPNNQYHFREWSFEEFRSFISKYFQVEEHLITNKQQRTQMIVCTILN